VGATAVGAAAVGAAAVGVAPAGARAMAGTAAPRSSVRRAAGSTRSLIPTQTPVATTTTTRAATRSGSTQFAGIVVHRHEARLLGGGGHPRGPPLVGPATIARGGTPWVAPNPARAACGIVWGYGAPYLAFTHYTDDVISGASS